MAQYAVGTNSLLARQGSASKWHGTCAWTVCPVKAKAGPLRLDPPQPDPSKARASISPIAPLLIPTHPSHTQTKKKKKKKNKKKKTLWKWWSIRRQKPDRTRWDRAGRKLWRNGTGRDRMRWDGRGEDGTRQVGVGLNGMFIDLRDCLLIIFVAFACPSISFLTFNDFRWCPLVVSCLAFACASCRGFLLFFCRLLLIPVDALENYKMIKNINNDWDGIMFSKIRHARGSTVWKFLLGKEVRKTNKHTEMMQVCKKIN